jgi:ribosomal protein L1
MAKLTKKQKELLQKFEKNKLYSLKDASALIKEVASAKFDESVDIAVVWVLIQEKQIKWLEECNIASWNW